MADEVRYERRRSAAWLTIDRPARRNALSPEAIEQLLRGLDRAAADPDVRAVCLTGAGDQAFCAGADLGALDDSRARPAADLRAGPRAFARLLQRMRSFERPLVARVNGHCSAGGLGPMLACDLAYAREGIRLGAPEVTVGLFPMMVAALLLRDGVRKKVLELVYTGGQVTAREAEGMGLLTRVVPDGALDAEVERVLDAVGRAAPLAVRRGRQALAQVEGLPPDAAVDGLCERLEELLGTDDAAEGLSAFARKRAPRWKGR